MGSSSESSSSSWTESLSSGNGTGYNGKIIYQQELAAGTCADDASNVVTQIDVEVTDGVATQAEIVRRNCSAIDAESLAVGVDVMISSDLTTAYYQDQVLYPEGMSPLASTPPSDRGISCRGTSILSGEVRKVEISTTKNMDGSFNIYVSVTSFNNFWYTQLTGVWDGYYLLAEDKFRLTQSTYFNFNLDMTSTSGEEPTELVVEAGFCD